MSERVLFGSLFGILLFMATASSQAATVTFGQTLINTDLNGAFSVDLRIDFTGDATLGGGLDIFFDPSALSFSAFDFGSTTLVLDPIFSLSPDLLPGKLEGLAFGEFFNGIEGPGVIGTLTFQAISPGSSTLSLSITTSPLVSGEFKSHSTGSLQDVEFGIATINVSAVPIPAAAWLFGSGLIALAGVVKKRRTLKHASPSHPAA